MWFQMRSMLDEFKVDIKSVAHIGAHWGEELEQYIQVGIDRIVLFEPLAANCKNIRTKIRDLNADRHRLEYYDIALYQTALGAEDKDEVVLAVSSNDAQSSSIMEPLVHLSQYPGITFQNKETASLKRLDGMGLGTFDMLNIDVQGYELEVLKGAMKTLESVKLIVVEVNRAELYRGCPMIEDLDEFLAQYALERKWTDWIGGTWGDAVYVKQENS